MERLHAMAISEDPGRRAIAANHPNVEPNDLDRLMHDPIVAVRVAAVKNFAMPQGWLYMLMRHDPDEGVRAYAKMRLGGDKWDS
jgi:hypothetical protein